MESRDHTRHRVLSEFRTLRRALIDSSSIIYMHKARFLRELANTVNLYSPPEIIKEAGFHDLNIKPVACSSNSLANDQKLITAALKLRWPVISEDKNILLHIRRANLPYFNSLMMLNFLLFKRRIDLKSHAIYFERLKQYARYSPYVWEFGKNIYNTIAHLCRRA
ncbi:MAG: hypothetical protein JSW47_22080 [Phycisphaerales bacterium]|nr:MAG: hypothetical protein JSW47_22080 [Phycisphaerales bacterium]